MYLFIMLWAYAVLVEVKRQLSGMASLPHTTLVPEMALTQAHSGGHLGRKCPYLWSYLEGPIL